MYCITIILWLQTAIREKGCPTSATLCRHKSRVNKRHRMQAERERRNKAASEQYCSIIIDTPFSLQAVAILQPQCRTRIVRVVSRFASRCGEHGRPRLRPRLRRQIIFNGIWIHKPHIYDSTTTTTNNDHDPLRTAVRAGWTRALVVEHVA